MTDLPEDFEEGLGDDVDRFLSGPDQMPQAEVDRLLSSFDKMPPAEKRRMQVEEQPEQAEEQPELVTPAQSPIVEAIGQTVAESGLFGCLILGSGLFYVVEWFKKNLGR